jgi:oligopeptide/dipeptide ABC transporter ATP-binding protein
MTNRINVMYAGYIVEAATTTELFANPSHPYTVGLLHSIPRVDAAEDEELIPIEGRPPDMRQSPVGCPFAARCAWRLEVCWEQNPDLTGLAPGRAIVATGPGASHRIACHNPPTPAEAALGRPDRPGFTPAPAPGGRVDELATITDLAADSARVDAYVEGAREAGAELPLGPLVGGLPVPPVDEHDELPR